MLLSAAYIYCSVFYFSWLVGNSPMQKRSLNWIDNMNEINIYNTAYYILIFSEWMDVEVRY